MNKVIIKNINNITDKNYSDIYNELDLEHKDRIKNYNTIRIKQHLASLYLLMQNNININDIKYNKNGKPYIKDINFSISHCEEYVVVVVSEKLVGVDIEKIRDYNHYLLNYLNISDEIISNKKFFVEYTKKEALIKMLGRKLSDINTSYDDCYYKSFIVGDYVISICYQK